VELEKKKDMQDCRH